MSIKARIESDLKQAMLARDKVLVTTLRGLKSAILYAEVSEGSRDVGLPDAAIETILQKELKKRQESADMYFAGGDVVKQQAELTEKDVIAKYLPPQLSQSEVELLVDSVISKSEKGSLNIGSVISAVRKETSGIIDGSMLATIVKERLAK